MNNPKLKAMKLARPIQVIDGAPLCQHLVAQVNNAPAYRLMTLDPYFNSWSMTYSLNALTMLAVLLMRLDHMGYI